MGIFSSDIYCGNLLELLKVNLTVLWGPSYDKIPLDFLTLNVVYTVSPAICQLQLRFSYCGSGSHSGFLSLSLNPRKP